MQHPLRSLALAVLSVVALAAPVGVGGQVVCEGEHHDFATACVLGVPDAHGVTLQSVLVRAGQVRAFKFRAGPGPMAAHLYLGDLWYNLDVSLYRDPPDETEIGRWLLGQSTRTGQRVLQFERPDIIVRELEPGLYTLFVEAADARSFDPGRPFTVRVALGPPVCAAERDPNDLYQLGLTFQPARPTAFGLMSFNAFLSPPYSDLFDFEWQLNDQPVAAATRETLQLAAADFPSGRNAHRVRVTARGVREYPDPDPRFRHVPPTLSVECAFPGL